jgi:hypothetical protein
MRPERCLAIPIRANDELGPFFHFQISGAYLVLVWCGMFMEHADPTGIFGRLRRFLAGIQQV